MTGAIDLCDCRRRMRTCLVLLILPHVIAGGRGESERLRRWTQVTCLLFMTHDSTDVFVVDDS